MDHYNRGLEKSIGAVRRHPQLQDRRRLGTALSDGQSCEHQRPARLDRRRLANLGHRHVLGRTTCRASPPQRPAVFRGGNRPIISTYDGWKPATKGDIFDPAVDRTIQPASFPSRPSRHDRKHARATTRSSGSHSNLQREHFGRESFPHHGADPPRLPGRDVQTPSTGSASAWLARACSRRHSACLSQTAGDQSNSPRQMQLALKLYF